MLKGMSMREEQIEKMAKTSHSLRKIGKEDDVDTGVIFWASSSAGHVTR